ncbi:hypothetical protein [Haloferula sp.]
MDDWQSWAAAGIVAITVVIFLVRALRRKSSNGSCDDCSCGKQQP